VLRPWYSLPKRARIEKLLTPLPLFKKTPENCHAHIAVCQCGRGNFRSADARVKKRQRKRYLRPRVVGRGSCRAVTSPSPPRSGGRVSQRWCTFSRVEPFPNRVAHPLRREIGTGALAWPLLDHLATSITLWLCEQIVIPFSVGVRSQIGHFPRIPDNAHFASLARPALNRVKPFSFCFDSSDGVFPRHSPYPLISDVRYMLVRTQMMRFVDTCYFIFFHISIT